MLNLFFEKTDNKAVSIFGETFLRGSSKLDSHYYILQRVKDGDSHYFDSNYFKESHPQLISYFTCWQEKDAVQEEVKPIKKPKELKDKKTGIGALLNKKNKFQNSQKFNQKQPKEEAVIKIEDVLFIQLQSFTQPNVPTDFVDIKQFMSLVFLLGMRIFEQLGHWPKLIPVITQSKRYKFIKKGKDINTELVRLFDYITKERKRDILLMWSQVVAHQLQQIGSQEDKTNILGTFLRVELESILQAQFKVRMRKGQEVISESVFIQDPFTLLLKQSSLHLLIQQYEIHYQYQNQSTRQIIMEHNIENTVVIQGNRDNLIIKYLKQFVTNG